MLALVVAGLLAASVPPAPARDTSLRVPGTALRFGMSQAQVQRVLLAQPAAPPVAPLPAGGGPPGAGGAAAPSVRVRFFGLEGQATLGFEGDALANVGIRVGQPSPYDIDFVEDELTRLGFRRRCDMREGLARHCDWTARAHVRLSTSETGLDAYLEPLAAPPGPVAGASTATLAGTAAPALPETLRLSLGDANGPPGAAPAPDSLPARPDSLPAPAVLAGCQPVRPEIARQSGVFGRVLVEATVDSSGRVVEARVIRGVPMLDDAALECARQYRFAPCAWRGRTHPFRVTLPIRFTQ